MSDMSTKDHHMVYQLHYKTILKYYKNYLGTLYSLQGLVKLAYHANFTRVTVSSPRTDQILIAFRTH